MKMDGLMKQFATIILLTICSSLFGQTFDSESKYTDSTGKSVIIQNSFPKGGGYIDGISGYTDFTGNGVITQNSFSIGREDIGRKRGYTDSTGKNYGYAIFWTRVINETATPLELTINFPADSFAIFPSPASYLKLFLPPDKMTLDKQSLYNYGITGLKSFLDTGFNKPTMLQKTINPNDECLFYIAALSYQAGGTSRAGLVLKGQDLFYRISIEPLGTALIPCGQIVFKY